MPEDHGHQHACGLCGAAKSVDAGAVIHRAPTRVAGVPIDLGHTAFRLRRCRRCGFQFKDPPIDGAKLLACYAEAAHDHWEERPDPRKRRFDTLRTLLERHSPGRRILDVGCCNGAILEYLGNGWQRFGLEPARDAAEVAATRGVEILGSTINSLAGDAVFDAVIMIDVVEHVVEPRATLARAAAALAPGGVLVIGTGDTGSWPFRLQGGRHWYAALPEHVSFFDERSLRHFASDHGLETVEHHALSHVRSHLYRRGRELAANLADAGLCRLGARRARPAPGWLTAADHMLHVMRRPVRAG